MSNTNYNVVKIQNCNCINNADIKIESNSLNIKFGINGTGKSTISKAIRAMSSGNKALLDELLPYGADKNIPDQCPCVLDMPFSNIMVFDESYAEKYLFQNENEGFFNDSFKVFLHSTECDELETKIGKMLEDLQSTFEKSEELNKVRSLLPQLLSKIKFKNEKVAKTGGIGEFIKGCGCGFEKHEELKPYQSYYSQEDFSKVTTWAKWRRDGIGQMQNDICPFCAADMENEKIEKQNTIIETVFKKSAIDAASSIMDYLKKAVENGFIKDEESQIFSSYMGDTSKESALSTELNLLVTETDYLNRQIEAILSFRPINVTREQIDDIEQQLNAMYIEEGLLNKFYCTEFMKNMFLDVNNKINDLRTQAGILKGLFKKYDDKLTELIIYRRDEINQFLFLAGFPYEFHIDPIGNGKAKTYLVPISDNTHAVSNLAGHLSWGERNAFSLVMFMYEAISESADLIVLDDPISSFDENKKFAIIRRLFDNKKSSLRDKTVLMLTHDTQPLIDFVKVDFFKRYGLTTNVHVMFIENEDGVISEREISSSDLQSIINLTLKIAKDINEIDVTRIVNLRKYVELTIEDYNNSPAYHILSNVIHGEEKPLCIDKTEMNQEDINIGCNDIRQYIEDFQYEDYINKLEDTKLLKQYKISSQYEQMLIARLYFERNTQQFAGLRKKYPALCKYLNESNHIENDYVFQLDPREYLRIPQCYLDQLSNFLSNVYIHSN